jgi:isopenicillin N synthase-like dioxygenase
MRSFARTFSSKVNYVANSPVVKISYRDLANKSADLSASISAAYGSDGLGLLVVSDVPEFVQLRQKLLPLAYKFANLPNPIKQKYEHASSFYQFGWSHGKESFRNGVPDLSKGSYYNNPIHDEPVKDAAIVKQYPTFCHPNIWPEADMPELRPAFRGLGQKITSVATLLAAHCDKFVRERCSTYPTSLLTRVIQESRIHKGRLLNYYPITEADLKAQQAVQQSEEDSIGSWCGWHNDHGSLTGLCPAMFFDGKGKQLDASPDPQAGLYIRSRKGGVVKAVMPADCLAFQMGETQQIQSGGILQATPHCVRSSSVPDVTRCTFALFMEPEWDASMQQPNGRTLEQTAQGSSVAFLPAGIPPIATRWNSQMNFGEFTVATLKGYHDSGVGTD